MRSFLRVGDASGAAWVPSWRWLPSISVAFALTLAACGEDDASLWIAQQEELGLAADEAATRGDWAEAERLLLEAVESEAPSSVAHQDANALSRDNLYRLADAALARGAWEDAEVMATRGLRASSSRDVFRTNLLIVRAEARRSRGDASGAASDYHEAVVITDELLQESLRDDVHIPLPPREDP